MRAEIEVRAGADPRETSRWAVIGTQRRPFEHDQPAVGDIRSIHGSNFSVSFHTINPTVILTQPAERCGGSDRFVTTD